MEEFIMPFFSFVCFVWLIFLQIKVEKLSDNIQNLSVVKKEDLDTEMNSSSETKEISSQNEKGDSLSDSNNEPLLQPVEFSTEDSQDASPSSQEVFSESIPKKPAFHISFVQLFSWLGGFILLLGIIFAIKYSLEKELISPTLRIVLGTLTGIGMWIAGALLRKPRVKTTSDTLCACGLCICYAVWFAAYYFYHMIPPAITLALLAFISFACFATAVWKNAQYIGILAQLVGFVTPFLFHSETPHIWFLLIYTGLINLAAVSAAVKRNWTHQLFTGMAFTFLCFIAIIQPGNLLQLTVFPMLFILLYAAVATWRQHTGLLRASFAFATITLLVLTSCASSLLPAEGLPYVITFALIFSIGFGLLSLWKKQEDLCFCALAFTFVAFISVATSKSFIALFILVGLLSFFFGILSAKWEKRSLQVGSMALAALGFITLFFDLTNGLEQSYLPYLTGFTVFFTLLFGIVSYRQKNTTLFLSTMGITLLFFLFLVPFRNEIYLTLLTTFFTLFFGSLSSKMQDTQLQLFSILLTALCTLFVCALGKLNLHFILGFALATTIFYGYFAVRQKNGDIFSAAAASLAIPFAILTIYTLIHNRGAELIGWLIAWNVLVTLTPFLFKSHFENAKLPWITVASCNLLAGALLLLICQIEKSALLGAGAVSFILAFFYALIFLQATYWQKLDEGNQKFRLNCLIWAPVVFLTLGIALQFTNHWETIAFAAEAFLLVWLWHSLRLNVSQNIGLGIFLLVMIRLVLNPFVLEYFEDAAPFFNGYLYTYGFCATMLFAAAYFWRENGNKSPIYLLRIGGGILLFVLLNIEIANSFSEDGTLSFNFCGGVSEAAAYTIAWALSGALCMFLAPRKMSWLVKVGIGLVGLAVLKLFLSDIWALSAGLRITVLIGVALIMLGISFIYQEFKKTTL